MNFIFFYIHNFLKTTFFSSFKNSTFDSILKKYYNLIHVSNLHYWWLTRRKVLRAYIETILKLWGRDTLKWIYLFEKSQLMWLQDDDQCYRCSIFDAYCDALICEETIMSTAPRSVTRWLNANHFQVSILSRLEDIDSDESPDFGYDRRKSEHNLSLILTLSILILRCIFTTYDWQHNLSREILVLSYKEDVMLSFSN